MYAGAPGGEGGLRCTRGGASRSPKYSGGCVGNDQAGTGLDSPRCGRSHIVPLRSCYSERGGAGGRVAELTLALAR